MPKRTVQKKVFTLDDLKPDKHYKIKAKSYDKNNKLIAESPFIIFRTEGKNVAPPPITNLVASYDSSTFVASWNATSARAENDFAFLAITLTSSQFPEKTVEYSTQSDTFSLSSDDNKFAFGGVATSITISVQAVDRTGNRSEAVTATANNAPPAAPTNVVVTAQNSGYSISWDDPRSADTDYLSTNIYESATSDGVYQIVYTSATTPVFVPAINFNLRYVKVSHIDLLGGESNLVGPYAVTPIQPVQVDTTPPDQRTSISYTAGVGQVVVSWTNPTDSTNNSDVAGVTIRYARISSPSNYTWVDIPFTFASPVSSATISGLLPLSGYNFSISTYDKTQNRTAYSTSTQVTTLADTTPPPRPVAPTVSAGAAAGGPMMVRVTQSAIEHGTTTPLPLDTYYFRVFMLNSGFSTAPLPGDSTNPNSTEVGLLFAAFNGGDAQEKFFVPLEEGEQRYFYTRAVDTSGNVSDASLSDQSDVMVVFDNAYISDLSADKIIAGRINANEYIQVGTTSEQITIKSTSTLGQIYSGEGTYNNSNTGIYIDTSGKFSLKNKLFFDGNDLTVEGKITATEGTFTGNIGLTTGGSLYSLGSGGTISTTGGPKSALIFNSSGIAAYNASGVATFVVTNSGDITIQGMLTAGSLAPYATINGLAQTNYTTIDGGNITTGSLKNSTYSASANDGSVFSTQGTMLNLDNGAFISKNVKISSSGAFEATGILTSTGLTVQNSTSTVSYQSWNSSTSSMQTVSNQAFALRASGGSDIFLGDLGGSTSNPAKIRWIYSGEQRAAIGFEPSDGQSIYPNTLVIRSHGNETESGRIVISAVRNGSIDFNVGTGSVTINGQEISGSSTGSITNRYRNGMVASPSVSNRITFGTDAAGNTNTNPQRGDVHLRY